MVLVITKSRVLDNIMIYGTLGDIFGGFRSPEGTTESAM